MNKNIIVSCFCFKDGWNGGTLKDKNNYSIYLKNSFVCLKSAKNANPEDECVLITNQILPKDFSDLFAQAGITTMIIPFEYFNFGPQYTWSLAFYKLNSLFYLNKHYDFGKVIVLDNDCYVTKNLKSIFDDCDDYILLYDLCRRLNSPEYDIFFEDLKLFKNNPDFFPYPLIGGEFVACNKSNLNILCEYLDKMFNDILSSKLELKSGDEFFLSCFAFENKNIVLNCGNYIRRYWTGMYRIHSENSEYNLVSILHCPSEKKYGFLKLFKLLKKNKKISSKRAFRILHLYHGHIHIPTIVWYWRQHLKRKCYQDKNS